MIAVAVGRKSAGEIETRMTLGDHVQQQRRYDGADQLRTAGSEWVGLIGTILLRTSDQPIPLRRHGNANAWYSSPS